MESASLFKFRQCIFQCNYSQTTSTLTVWFSGLPKPLYALQVNVPAAVRLMFGTFSTFPSCTTRVFPWFPAFSLVQETFASSRLDTLQINCRLLPSRTVGLPSIPVILNGTKSNQRFIIKLPG